MERSAYQNFCKKKNTKKRGGISKVCKTSILGHTNIISSAWLDDWSSRAILDLTSRLDEYGAKVECWSLRLHLKPATEDLNHQDPLLHRHGSQPTANRLPHLVASCDMQGGARDLFLSPRVSTGVVHLRHSWNYSPETQFQSIQYTFALSYHNDYGIYIHWYWLGEKNCYLIIENFMDLICENLSIQSPKGAFMCMFGW